jgi:hypothetical protein
MTAKKANNPSPLLMLFTLKYKLMKKTAILAAGFEGYIFQKQPPFDRQLKHNWILKLQNNN